MSRVLKAMLAISALIFVVPVYPINAQEDRNCTAAAINTKIAELTKAYEQKASSADSTDSVIAAAKELREAVDELIKSCENTQQRGSQEPKSVGTGTLEDPFVFNHAVEVEDGYTVRVVKFISNANQQIQRANMFNDRPNNEQRWIIIEVEITCLPSAFGTCESNYFDYQLVGSKGEIYEHPFVVLDNELDVNLLPGASKTGLLPFLVGKDESDFKLIKRQGLFSRDLVFYAQPLPSEGVEITARQNVNIRSGPGTSQPVVGSLSRGSTDIAIGRNETGDWLQIASGWVSKDVVTANGDTSLLPVTSK